MAVCYDMAAKSLFQQLWDGVADAIADIRQKVVEEPWFGRAVTGGAGHDPAPHWPEAKPPPAFGSHTREIYPAYDRTTEERHQPPEPEYEI
jgi:hypothetical protein